MPEEGEPADQGEESKITYEIAFGYCSLGKDSVGSRYQSKDIWLNRNETLGVLFVST
jgi:hypothetical protein